MRKAPLLDRLRAKRARRLLHFAACAPVLLVALTVAAQGPTTEDCRKHEELAQIAGAKLSPLFDGGLFVGFGLVRMMQGSRLPVINLSISTDVYNYNIRTFALAAGLGASEVALVVTTVDSGKWVGNNTTAAPYSSLQTGSSWPTGTQLRLVNNGTIAGRGGEGGDGNASTHNGGAGEGAYHAISLAFDLSIDNTNGYIFGGSAGAGAGADYASGSAAAGGGGGGGGRGNPGGAFGAPSAYGTAGSYGTVGDRTDGGVGGAGGHDAFYLVDGGVGGTNTGLGWAAVGSAGASTATHSGGSGGFAGLAILKGGKAVTWLGGYNGTQVKGAIT